MHTKPIRTRMRGVLLGVVAIAATTASTGCTQEEIQRWIEWNEVDPVAAQEFANSPEVQARLQGSNDTDESTGGWTLNWDKVAQCESGGNWSHGPVHNGSGTFSGGLMWNHRYWIANGGGQYAQYPYQATRAEQIRISENVIGGSYSKADQMWQCIGGPARSGV